MTATSDEALETIGKLRINGVFLSDLTLRQAVDYRAQISAIIDRAQAVILEASLMFSEDQTVWPEDIKTKVVELLEDTPPMQTLLQALTIYTEELSAKQERDAKK